MNFRPGKSFFIVTLFVSLAVFVSLRPGSAQSQKPQDPATVRIETELVQVDVVVTDKQGKLIKDLRREDFQLLEDGKPQTISHFSVGTANRQAVWLKTGTSPANKNAPALPTALPNATPLPIVDAGRYLVLAIDDIHLKAGNLMLAKQTLNKFIDQQLGIRDQVALITTSGQVGMFQQFTTNREAMHRAVNRLSVAARTATNNFDVPHITPYQAELIEDRDTDALELAVQELMAKFSMDRRMATSEAQSRARMIIQENRNLTINTLSTIENIIKDLRA
ncbi:MAG: VWA domain-containing protein, partial [Blastocatellia bacterium]